MGKVIDVMSLYPKDMNIYGDSGNVLVVLRRLALYGYEPRLHAYNQGDEWPERVDMILGGGGQDTGQKKITGDLFKRAGRLRDLAADGTPMLMICGLFQLFGEYFETSEGERLDGINVLGAYTVGQSHRMIGNLVEHSDEFGDVIGYENHSGQTFLREERCRWGMSIMTVPATTARIIRKALVSAMSSARTCTARCCRRTPRSRIS